MTTPEKPDRHDQNEATGTQSKPTRFSQGRPQQPPAEQKEGQQQEGQSGTQRAPGTPPAAAPSQTGRSE